MSPTSIAAAGAANIASHMPSNNGFKYLNMDVLLWLAIVFAARCGSPQRRQQGPQTIMIQLLHQCQEATDFALRKAVASEPVQVMAGQVGHQTPLVLAKGHDARDQQFKIFGVHGKYPMLIADAGDAQC